MPGTAVPAGEVCVVVGTVVTVGGGVVCVFAVSFGKLLPPGSGLGGVGSN